MAKAAKRSSPRKSLRVRSGVAVGSPEGDVRKAARDGGGGGGREGVAEVAGGDVRRRSRRLFDGNRGGTSAECGLARVLMGLSTNWDWALGLARVGWWASRPGTRGRAGAAA